MIHFTFTQTKIVRINHINQLSVGPAVKNADISSLSYWDLGRDFPSFLSLASCACFAFLALIFFNCN